MKKIILYCLSVLVFNSCTNDFLTTAPEHELTDEVFFITENHFRQATVGIYQPLRDHGYATSCWLMGEMRSDNTHYIHYSANRMLRNEEIANFLNTSLNEYTDSYWRVSYYANAKATTLIDPIAGRCCSDEV